MARGCEREGKWAEERMPRRVGLVGMDGGRRYPCEQGRRGGNRRHLRRSRSLALQELFANWVADQCTRWTVLQAIASDATRISQ
jgi:hypothetical protein